MFWTQMPIISAKKAQKGTGVRDQASMAPGERELPAGSCLHQVPRLSGQGELWSAARV